MQPISSQLAQSAPSIFFLDFAQAFPSPSHVWMWGLLRRLNIYAGLLHLIMFLHNDLVTTTFCKNTSLQTFALRSGIKQGCPLSGTFFAIAVDPVQAHMHDCMLRSSLIILFADDVAIVVRDIHTQLGAALRQLRRWSRATRLRLKPKECQVVRLTDDEVRCRTQLGRHEDSAEMQLGTRVGPT